MPPRRLPLPAAALLACSGTGVVIGHDDPISVRVCPQSLCRKATAVATLTK